MKALGSLLLFSLLILPLAAEDVRHVTVLGDRVNLRTGNTLEHDVVSRADYGDKLEMVSLQEKWVEVRAPAGFEVWVFSPLLFEDKEVRAPELNVRGGPGTQFPVVGELSRGDVVEVLESREDWRRIAVPAKVTLWISREFVQLPPEAEAAPAPVPTPVPAPEPHPEPHPEPEPEPTPMPTPQPTPLPVVEVITVERIVEVTVTPTPEPAVEAPPGLNLVPLKGQGNLSVRRGQLRAYLLAGSSPSRFLLVREDPQGAQVPLAYLVGDEEALKNAAGKRVSVQGRDFWVVGQRLPVTEVRTLETMTEAP